MILKEGVAISKATEEFTKVECYISIVKCGI